MALCIDSCSFDEPISLTDAITAYLEAFEVEPKPYNESDDEEDLSDKSYWYKQLYSKAGRKRSFNKEIHKEYNKLRQIRNILKKKLSEEKEELLRTKFKPYVLDSIAEYIRTRNRDRWSTGIVYVADTYPIYAMRNFFVRNFNENDAVELSKEFDEQLSIKRKNKIFKDYQEKHPNVVTCYGGTGGCKRRYCYSCHPNRDTKGKNRERYNERKFSDC